MSEQYLRGQLGFKGERGYSAYEIAVQNGFKGTESQWLSTLGSSVYLAKDSTVYTATANQTVFTLPDSYSNVCCLDVFVNGFKLAQNAYTIDYDTKTITLGATLDEGTEVEVGVYYMSSALMPVTDNINQNSTNEDAARS